MRAQKIRGSMAGSAACDSVTTLCGAAIDGKDLQLALLPRSCAERSPRIAAHFFMAQGSACFPGKCTIAVQFATPSITSVFRKQSVVKDRFSSAVKPVNRMYNEGCE
jgi:hypothetical protein